MDDRSIGPRVPYLMPGQTWVRPKRLSLASYATQHVIEPVRRHGAETAVLVPGMADGASMLQPTELTKPDPGWWVLSAWNPHGRPTTLEENLALADALFARLRSAGVDAHRTVAYAPDRSWAENAVAVRPGDTATVTPRELAREVGAAAFTVYFAGRMRVSGTDGEDLSVGRYHREPAPVGCPILAAPREDDLCRMHGGPWTRRSRDAGHAWATHRELLLAALGCTHCDAGPSIARRYGIVERDVTSCASRWWGPVDIRRRTDEELDAAYDEGERR